MSTTTWTLTVPSELDEALRETLAAEGGGDDALSRFVADAVVRQIVIAATAPMKRAAAHLSASEVQDLADEAVAWARKAR